MLTVQEVAKRLNVAPSTVYGLVARGKLQGHRIGLGRGTIRISEHDLALFLEGSLAGYQDSSARESRRLVPLKHIKLKRREDKRI